MLEGDRYEDRPIYFSDVIVRTDSDIEDGFASLRGRSWAYNEPNSHSGYNVTRYRLLQMGETGGFFGRVVRAGSHAKALRLVAAGEVDAAAIDSQVLAVELRDHPELAAAVRVIDQLGPSSIQPVVASSRLPEKVKQEAKRALLDLGQDAESRRALAKGFVRRFAEVEDGDYDDIRQMLEAAERTGFMTLG
ncbi:MAG: hypothetical protein Kow00129_01210 [Thermoleophilia bacterium]